MEVRINPMFGDCCTRFFGQGESVCPVCHAQRDAWKEERERADAFRVSASDLKPGARELMRRGAMGADALGMGSTAARAAAARNPNRRALFKLLGIYLPEEQAREALRNIHDFKWIEAEKAGCDIWATSAPDAPPLGRAARVWSMNHLQSFLSWHNCRAA